MQNDIEITLAIIKPDAYSFRKVGAIISIIEENKLNIIGAKVLKLTHERASSFYTVHGGKDFYPKLIDFMTSGPIMTLALAGPNAVARWREIMGPTDSAVAPEGTIRNLYGSDTRYNAVHGSDSAESAKSELEFFFTSEEILSLSAE